MDSTVLFSVQIITTTFPSFPFMMSTADAKNVKFVLNGALEEKSWGHSMNPSRITRTLRSFELKLKFQSAANTRGQTK